MKNFSKVKKTIFVLMLLGSTQAHAGIPVVDIPGIIQSVLSYVEEALQTINQGEQLVNEVTMIENQIAQAEREVQQLQQLPSKIKVAIGTFDLLRSAADRIDALAFTTDLKASYDSYKNINDWRTSNDFSAGQLSSVQNRWYTQQLETAKSTAQVLQASNTQIGNDKQTLDDMQLAAQNATGDLQIAQANGQLASLQNDQLMQMRTLMMSQQQMEIQQVAQQAERDSIEAARHDKEVNAFLSYGSNSFR